MSTMILTMMFVMNQEVAENFTEKIFFIITNSEYLRKQSDTKIFRKLRLFKYS